MEPNQGSAIIKIDKVPFKVVMSTIKSKSINAKINSSEKFVFYLEIYLLNRSLHNVFA